MTDLPHLAFALAACALVVSGVDRDDRRLLAAAGALLALACLTQYRALVFVPLFLGYAWLQGRRLLPVGLAVVPSLVLLGLWSWWNRATLGVPHILDAGGSIPLTPERVLRDGIAYVSFLGGATVFPLFLVFVVRRRLRSPAVWASIAVVVSLIVGRWAPDHRGLQGWLLALFCAVGLATAVGLLPPRSAWREGLARAGGPRWSRDAADELFLLAAAGTLLASQVLLNLFASVRSLLLALPFLVLLLVRRLEAEAASGAAARRQLVAGTATTVILGLAVAMGDYQLALAERELGARVDCPGEGCRVWFSGEWGFRDAMVQRGHRYLLTSDDSPREGDVLVMPDLPCPSDLHPAVLPRLELVQVRESERRFPLKVLSFRDHAAFYSNFFGLLPYSFSSLPLDRVRVFRLRERAPEAGGGIRP
jgi:hypothetical protein